MDFLVVRDLAYDLLTMTWHHCVYTVDHPGTSGRLIVRP